MTPRLLLSMLFALALAACAPRTAPESAARALVIALPADLATLDPHMTAAVGGNLSVLGHLYPALVERGPDLKLGPALAESWQALSPTHWRFRLAPGARFADGEPLDAAAVKWNLERVLDPAIHARIRFWFEPIVRVEAPDARTLDIHTRTAFPALPAQLSMLLLLPPRWAARHDPATEVSSGGPYELVENVPGDHLRLRRNPGYWGRKPAFAEVEFRIIPAATARVAALLAGEVDLITGLPLAEVARIRASGRAQAGSVPSIRSVFVKLNTLAPPLDDVRVRRALNYAIDKQAISQALFDGQAPVLQCQLLTPEYLGFDPVLKPYPYDPARARALLREAGIAAGTRLELEVPVNYTPQGEEVAQVVAAQLQAVGLDVRLTQLDSAYYMDKYIKARKLGALSLLTHAWPTIDADGLLSLLHSDSPYAYYRDPELDRLLAEGRGTLDAVARERIYHRAEAHLCEQAPVIFLYAQPATWAASPRIHWQPRGDDWIRAYDIAPAPR
ncbi:hypothetical protein JR065_16090 [Xanthomonas sp. AmX2]|uniref:ABC transporter substrate-binding protein n=1 Tax=Xanthomonas sp. TaxID=29446 RepID=UPI00197CEA95|nr:ABC transporter substrate-binding protein [Xanthomonas sp.]MBN6151868.1 hypothetical protein [Xanthomonas sp.]